MESKCEKCGVTKCKACVIKDKKAFDSWLDDLQTKEQPACSTVSGDDCEACGS